MLLVNPSPVRGGAEELLLDFCSRHDPARVTPLVACLADGPFPDDLSAAGVPIRRIRAGRLRHPWSWARAVARLTVLAKRSDVVLSWQVKGNYYGTPAARFAGRPAAWWDHGIRPKRGEPRYLVDARLPAALRADFVVCSSQAAADRHSPSRAILPGIPLDPYLHPDRAAARALLGIAEDIRAVGIVGRLQPWKGQHLFLSAAVGIHLRFPDARFFVVGGTPGGFSAGYPLELRALADRLGIAHLVSFLGQREDVPALLPGLDCFVLASFHEPFGMVTVEAMAAGVPVVATGSGGVPEVITHERHGLLVPVGSHDAIADAVCRVLGDPDLAAHLVEEGRKRALHDFDVMRYVREVEELVVALAEGRLP